MQQRPLKRTSHVTACGEVGHSPPAEKLVTSPAVVELVIAPTAEKLATSPAAEKLVIAPTAEKLDTCPAAVELGTSHARCPNSAGRWSLVVLAEASGCTVSLHNIPSSSSLSSNLLTG